jgi:hypothetical protein
MLITAVTPKEVDWLARLEEILRPPFAAAFSFCLEVTVIEASAGHCCSLCHPYLGCQKRVVTFAYVSLSRLRMMSAQRICLLHVKAFITEAPMTLREE